ncbi:MAG: hypothetical protein KJ070_21420, partial [Verrucomicrobia bacterium]|nr:hypothetical protein [Verrucomicrobiota bacterium]
MNTGPLGTASRSDLNFVRSSSISGAVRLANGTGIGGVTISRGAASGTTAANGSYTFSGLSQGNYTITPSLAGYVFRPTNLLVTIGPSKSGQNFTVANPVATTLAATAVALGNATLNGSVIGEGTQESRVWFEYGTSGSFNLATPIQIFPTNTNSVPVSAPLVNLTGGLSYNFRCVAANDNGTNHGTAMTFRMPFPGAGNAVSFDGVNDYIQVGVNPVLKLTTNITVEAWINATGPGNGSSGSGGVIVNKEGEYEFARYADGTLRYAIANSSPGWSFINTTVVVPLSNWTHFAFTYDSTVVGNNIRIYTNGVLAYSTNGTGAIGDTATSQNDFRIGGRQGLTQYFQGQIDEVRIWNAARSDSEIASNFQRRLTGSEPRLVASFPFNEGMGITTTDSGPNGLVGALTGGATFVVSGALIRDPIVTTLPATPVLATTATLRGTVNPSGEATSYFFEYGPSLTFGRTTTPQNIPGTGLAP